MIFSAQQLFSDNQAILVDSDSTNVIDLGTSDKPYDAFKNLNHDVGKGAKISVLVQVTENFDNLDNLRILLVTGMTPLVLNDVLANQVIQAAELIIGRQFSLDFLPNQLTQRYLGVLYIINGTLPTMGRVTAGITLGNQTNDI